MWVPLTGGGLIADALVPPLTMYVGFCEKIQRVMLFPTLSLWEEYRAEHEECCGAMTLRYSLEEVCDHGSAKHHGG